MLPTKRLLAVLILFARSLVAGSASAAEPEPLPPLQGTPSQPPPQLPPPQSAPPHYQPAYASPYPAQPYYAQRPRKRSYVEGDPVPVGFHVEERPREGLVTAGFIVLLLPYGLSAVTALAAQGANETSWLYAPVVGPWLTMGYRQYGSCQRPSTDESLRCVADIFVVMGLTIDGIMQVTGATLLLTGYLVPKNELVRDEQALRIRPMRVGDGYGVGLSSAF